MNTLMNVPLSIADILLPCSNASACGDDTRLDTSPHSPYFTLKDLRHQARSLERKNLMDDDPQPPEQWRKLLQLLPETLQQRSKDLELLAWLIEALCREHGFAGLTAGFTLARAMIEQYWDTLHPQPDQDGMEIRLAALAGLNGYDNEGTLIQPILSIPLIFSKGTRAYATWQCEQGAEVARLDKARADKKIQNGAVAPDALALTAREMTDSDILATHQQLLQAITAFQQLSASIDQRAGAAIPSSRIDQTLQRCLDTLTYLAGERLQRLLNTAPAPALTDTAEAAVPSGVTAVQTAIGNREQAVQQLRFLADLFRRTEPHSPVSYAIEQAVRWSQMSLPELMAELIDDSGARTHFCRLTGVPADQ